jgi:hypothetical protein
MRPEALGGQPNREPLSLCATSSRYTWWCFGALEVLLGARLRASAWRPRSLDVPYLGGSAKTPGRLGA